MQKLVYYKLVLTQSSASMAPMDNVHVITVIVFLLSAQWLYTNDNVSCRAPVGEVYEIQAELMDPPRNVIDHGQRQVISYRTFRFFVQDQAGFFSDKAPVYDPETLQTIFLGNARREQVRSVLADMWHTLQPVVPHDTAFLDIELVIATIPGENAAGWAEPVNLINTADRATVVEPAAISVIRTGLDPRRFIRQWASYHGRITLNTVYQFDFHRMQCAADKVSLYGIVLHELMHILGVYSLIGSECLPGGSHTVTPISRLDAMLLLNSDGRLPYVGCDGTVINIGDRLRGSCELIYDAEQKAYGVEPVETAPKGCPSDMSHLYRVKPNSADVMRSSFMRGEAIY